MNYIYLDHNATTPLDPRVLAEMMPYFRDFYANASSVTHRPGRIAAEAVEKARTQVADLIGARSEEITFTSGATEAINMVLKGIFHRYQSKGKHFVTSRTEHKAVLDTFNYLEQCGAEVTYLSVNASGQISLDELAASIRVDTVMVALMSANNETGILLPLEKIAEICQQKETLFFCDATQSIGKLPLDLNRAPIDILCLSAHKLYGPKGVGALYVRKKNKRVQIDPLLHGGKQEQSLRAGTLNVPGIVGLGTAAEIAASEMKTESQKLENLRLLMESRLNSLPEIKIQGQNVPRLPNSSNIAFKHLRASEIMVNLPELALASGSACVSGTRDPSHVLLAMGLSPEDAFASIRISMGRFNTEKEILDASDLIIETINKLRSESPIWHLYNKGLIK